MECKKCKGGGRHSFLREKLMAGAPRLDGVIIEGKDWRDLVRVYDGPETLFFFDPPYTTGESGRYAKWTASDAESLAEALAGLQGQFILTIDDTAENLRRFGRWLVARRDSKSSRNGKKAAVAMPELIAASPVRGAGDALKKN